MSTHKKSNQPQQKPLPPQETEKVTVKEESVESTQPLVSKPLTPADQMADLNQRFYLLALVVAALFFFQIFQFYEFIKLKKEGVKAAAGAAAGQQAESHLTVDKLKTYAKDMGLNEDKFNQCLDNNAKKDIVAADAKEAGELGVQGTPGFFINGKFLGGAFPIEFFKEIIDKEIAGTGSTDCTAYSEELQKYCSGDNPAFIPMPKEVNLKGTPMKGSENAKVTLVEFSDFECPFCVRAFPTVEQVLKDYPNDVKIYYKHLPLSFHPNAQKAAEASMCAQDQGKFWEYHDTMFNEGLKAQGQ